MQDVTWNFPSYKKWEEERRELMNLPDINEIEELNRIAQFFAKTVDKISKCLAYGQKLPLALFEGLR